VLHNASIYARGFAVNVVLVGQFLLAASVITMLYFSVRDAAWWPTRLLHAVNPSGVRHFAVTLDLALLLFAGGIVWGIFQSSPSQANATEIPGRWAKPAGWLIIGFFIMAFCELQPFILDAMFDSGSSDSAVAITHWINTLTTVLAPVGVAMAFLANKFGEYVKSIMQSPGSVAQTKAVALKLIIFAGGLILPVAIWMIYLDITYWGICIDRATGACLAPAWLAEAAYALFNWPVPGFTILCTCCSIGQDIGCWRSTSSPRSFVFFYRCSCGRTPTRCIRSTAIDLPRHSCSIRRGQTRCTTISSPRCGRRCG
jgi:hypothetical protein